MTVEGPSKVVYPPVRVTKVHLIHVNNPTTHGRGFTAPIVDGAKTAGSSGSGGFDWIEAGEMNGGMIWAEDVR